MDKEMIMKFKTIFEKQKENLIYSQKIMNEDFNLQKDDMMDEVDLTSFELETQMRMRLRNREALFMKKIDKALSKIRDGSFGECEDCGEDIEMKRLEARPTSTLCVLCKEDQEHRERMHIDGRKSKSMGANLRLA